MTSMQNWVTKHTPAEILGPGTRYALVFVDISESYRFMQQYFAEHCADLNMVMAELLRDTLHVPLRLYGHHGHGPVAALKATASGVLTLRQEADCDRFMHEAQSLLLAELEPYIFDGNGVYVHHLYFYNGGTYLGYYYAVRPGTCPDAVYASALEESAVRGIVEGIA